MFTEYARHCFQYAVTFIKVIGIKYTDDVAGGQGNTFVHRIVYALVRFTHDLSD